MRYSVLLFTIFFYACLMGQSLLSTWTGTYQGTMELYAKESTPFSTVLVRLSIHEIRKDSVWSYYMIYGEKDKPGYIEKKYQLELKSDGLTLDEGGGVLIPMRLFGDCLIDFYSIEDSDNTNSYMSSVLCRQASGDLEYNLFGGPLEPLKTTQIIEETDATVFGLNTYPVGFDQHVILKRIDE